VKIYSPADNGDKMIFKELINIVDYDDVWEILVKEYNHKHGIYNAYKSVFEELKTLQSKPCKPPITLVVAKVEDCLEADKFIFDVFGVINGDKNHYALEMSSWCEWLSFNVLNRSIEVYGIVEVAAHSLYEMTFFGYSSKAVDETVEKEKNILNKRVREIDDGTAQLISYEDAMAKIGLIDKRTPVEKEKDYREYTRIAARNEKIYKMLLEGNLSRHGGINCE